MKEEIYYIKDGKGFPLDENNVQDCEGLVIRGTYTKEEALDILSSQKKLAVISTPFGENNKVYKEFLDVYGKKLEKHNGINLKPKNPLDNQS